jgi:multiple sugar transport system permease protein
MSLRAAGRHLGEILWVAPALLLVGAVILLPASIAAMKSFTAWSPGYPSPWVGLANYRDLFSQPIFREVLGNQAFLLLGLPVWVFMPLLIAALLYDRVPGAGVFRTIIFFPAILSPAIIGILFRTVLGPDGSLNEVLRASGLGVLARPWLEDPDLVKPAIIVLLAWASLGTGVIIFSAALSAIPAELFEAAEIDGANWFRRFLHVLVPSIAHIIVFWAVFQVVSVFLFIFGWIWVLTRGGPGYASTTIDFDIYQNALTFGFFGIAAAESVVLFVIVLSIVTVGLVGSRLVRMRTS